MNALLTACGFFCLGFVVFHLFFWKLFHWKKELAQLNFVNRAVMQIMNVQLIYYFASMAVLCFFFQDALINSVIGQFTLMSTAGFCLVRLIQQFIFFKPNHPAINGLSVLFLAGTIMFSLAFVWSYGG